MFDWNDLRHFLAVARNGSTIAASKALGVSQSTVHRRLAELEKSLAHPLVARHATGYRLTEFGKELQPFALRVEEAVEALERRLVASNETLTGSVRVTCSESDRLQADEITCSRHLSRALPGPQSGTVNERPGF